MNSLFFTVWNIGKCRTCGLLSGNRKRSVRMLPTRFVYIFVYFFVDNFCLYFLFTFFRLLWRFWYRCLFAFKGPSVLYGLNKGCPMLGWQGLSWRSEVCLHFLFTFLFTFIVYLFLFTTFFRLYPDHCTNLTFAAAGQPPR